MHRENRQLSESVPAARLYRPLAWSMHTVPAMLQRAKSKEGESAVAHRLIESGIELVRAEIAVAIGRAKDVSVRALTALLATLLAGAFLQVAIVIGVLYPLLQDALPSRRLLLALVLPAGLAVICIGIALAAWGGLAWSRLRRNLSAFARASEARQAEPPTAPQPFPNLDRRPLPKE